VRGDELREGVVEVRGEPLAQKIGSLLHPHAG
jgi:hypothetical protein